MGSASRRRRSYVQQGVAVPEISADTSYIGIDDQIKEAQIQIDKELDEFGKNRQQSDKSDDRRSWHQLISQNHAEKHTAKDPGTTNEPDDTDRRDAVIEPESKAEPSNGPGETVKEEEDQAPAKSANSDDSKPAEVPDSDPTNNDTNKTAETKDGQAAGEKEERMEDAQDEEDHVVEVDEDTVIY